MEFNAAGEQRVKRDGRGLAITYGWDPAGRGPAVLKGRSGLRYSRIAPAAVLLLTSVLSMKQGAAVLPKTVAVLAHSGETLCVVPHPGSRRVLDVAYDAARRRCYLLLESSSATQFTLYSDGGRGTDWKAGPVWRLAADDQPFSQLFLKQGMPSLVTGNHRTRSNSVFTGMPSGKLHRMRVDDPTQYLHSLCWRTTERNREILRQSGLSENVYVSSGGHHSLYRDRLDDYTFLAPGPRDSVVAIRANGDWVGESSGGTFVWARKAPDGEWQRGWLPLDRLLPELGPDPHVRTMGLSIQGTRVLCGMRYETKEGSKDYLVMTLRFDEAGPKKVSVSRGVLARALHEVP